MQITNLHLKRYLLGSLDEPAGEEIGQRIISDKTFEENLLIAENELIEDFLEKNLSPAEEKLFYENFLVCDAREKLLEEITFFRQYAKKRFQAENPVTDSDLSENGKGKIKRPFIFDWRFAALVPAVLLIVFLAIGFYFYYPPEKLTVLEKEYAALNNENLANPADYASLTTVNLMQGAFRDSGAGSRLKAENLTGRIFFRLALPFNLNENKRLEAELVRDQKTVFRQPEIRVYQNASGQEIRLLLPKSVLSKGQYQIKIENPNAEDSPVTYYFAVE